MKWLPGELKCTVYDALMFQAARDARLAELLFDYKSKVRELSALDLAHLFLEAGGQVCVTSYESADALDAIVARSGLPESVLKFPMLGNGRGGREVVVEELLKEYNWAVVYELGLTPSSCQSIMAALNGRGVFVNVAAPNRTRETEELILRSIEDRWKPTTVSSSPLDETPD